MLLGQSNLDNSSVKALYTDGTRLIQIGNQNLTITILYVIVVSVVLAKDKLIPMNSGYLASKWYCHHNTFAKHDKEIYEVI